WFGDGAMSAPQDGSRPRETARSEDFRLRLPSGRALARKFNFSQASLCNAFPSILEVFSRPGNSHGPGPEPIRSPDRHRWDGGGGIFMRLLPPPPFPLRGSSLG